MALKIQRSGVRLMALTTHELGFQLQLWADRRVWPESFFREGLSEPKDDVWFLIARYRIGGLKCAENLPRDALVLRSMLRKLLAFDRSDQLTIPEGVAQTEGVVLTFTQIGVSGHGKCYPILVRPYLQRGFFSILLTAEELQAIFTLLTEYFALEHLDAPLSIELPTTPATGRV